MLGEEGGVNHQKPMVLCLENLETADSANGCLSIILQPEGAELMYVRNGRVACVIYLAGFEGEAATQMAGLCRWRE